MKLDKYNNIKVRRNIWDNLTIPKHITDGVSRCKPSLTEPHRLYWCVCSCQALCLILKSLWMHLKNWKHCPALAETCKEQSGSLASLILHFKCFPSVHINNRQVRYDITLCPFHQLIGCCGQMAVWCNWVVGYSEFMKLFNPPSSSSSLVSCMKLASCPGQGLCLSHARLDPRHFIALTLPPTVTAALNEATHMCLDQVGAEPGLQLKDDDWASLALARRWSRAQLVSAWCFYSTEESGPSQCIKQGQWSALSDYSEDYRA